jgi:hypothetical protein
MATDDITSVEEAITAIAIVAMAMATVVIATMV